MSLVDLQSDLSKFRSEVSRDPKSTPEASKATNNKNFATVQPITAKLAQFSKQIQRQEPKQLETKLGSTKLDDIRKISIESVLLNTVSKYSAINEDYNTRNIGNVTLQSVVSRFDDIRKEEFVSRLTDSKIEITRQSIGNNNLISPIQLNIVDGDQTNNISNPNIEIRKPNQSVDRTTQSPEIVQGVSSTNTIGSSPATDNITNPDIEIERVEQTLDRTTQSPDLREPRSIIGGASIRSVSGNVTNPDTPIERQTQSTDRASQSPDLIGTPSTSGGLGLNSAQDNITNPNITVERVQQSVERVSQSPNIITETIQEGLVVNPDTKVLRIENGTFNLTDESRLNLDGQPIRFTTTSRLVNFDAPREPDTEKYSGETNQDIDNSSLNLDVVIKTNPGGRHENPDSSGLSIIGTQQVNFFPDTQVRGFVVNAQSGVSYYSDSSVFGWSGNRNSAPTTNFITDINGTGFTKFATIGQTEYSVESSAFGFTTPPSTDFFDVTKTYASEGFKTFVTSYESAYNPESSAFTWTGTRDQAPETSYFDETTAHTTAGFHKFAQVYDTKFIPGASIFDWDGNRDSAQEVNYFDVTGVNSSVGFHRFAQLYDTKFIADSSVFDWDGTKDSAPEVNYFDVSGANTTTGFHKFAQLYDSKYSVDSSVYNWDGVRDSAPEVNYFDLGNKNTNSGFHKFAQLYDSKYLMESSAYNWDGNQQQAPEVNFFDLNATNAVGFHKFAQIYDTKFIHQSSVFDWDGTRAEAPEVNYFDIDGGKTSIGFHKFAQIYDSKYLVDSSIYDWDGKRPDAPEVNYFDLTGASTSKGFEKETPAQITRYIKDASRFTFKGSNQNAPEIDVFDKNKKYAIKGFEKFPQRMVTKYVRDASEFTFSGVSRSAPNTNFFPDTQASGFTTFAQKLNSEYETDVSEFTFKGGLPTEVNYFTDSNASGFINKTALLETKFEHETSRFTFKGSTPEAIDFIENTNADGFHIKAQLNDTKFVSDSSVFTFKGDGKSSDTTNFFDDASATGFTSFPQLLVTEYLGESSFGIVGSAREAEEIANGGEVITSGPLSRLTEKDSIFDWGGSRQDSPEVDFFKIQGSNPNGIAGFTRLFDNTQTKLTDEFSRFSFAAVQNLSKIKNAPYTTFFGYNPAERTGFMAGMTNGESTLYPIVDPVLRYDEIPNRRFEIESARGSRKRLQTANREKYAPLSLGKRPWAEGTLSATLENQVPGILTGAIAGSYENKYERGVKDNTEQKGYLTKWAITRRSPSELDKQYSKFNLRNDSFNFDLTWSQPFVLRGIQGGLEPERWGGILRGADDGVARGGIATQLERVLFDEQRIGKYLTSIKGIAWNLRQVGLQLMNPVVDVDPKTPESSIDGYSSTHIFNPLSVLANVATARIGFHVARHGAVSFDSPYLNRYETATINRELTEENAGEFSTLESPTLENKTRYNRLIGLMKELLPNSFSPYVGATNSEPPQDGLEDPSDNGIQSPRGGVLTSANSQIVRISSTSRGPQSLLGIGGTTFTRASHPYLTNYTTAPDLTVGETLPAYLETAKRDTFYSANATYAKHMLDYQFTGILKAIADSFESGPRIANDTTALGDTPFNVQKNVIDDIAKSEVFSPVHETIESRVQRRTKDSFTKTSALLANSMHPDNVDKDSLIKQYRVANYDRLGRNQEIGNRFFNDFRNDVDVDWESESAEESPGRSVMTNPKIARFGSRNLSERYGFGDQGRPGVRRDTPYLSTIDYKKFSDSDIIRTNEGPAEFHDYAVPF